MSKKLKIGIAFVGILVVLIIAAIGVRAIQTRAQDTDLSFVTTPNEVGITIDGEDYGEVTSGETITVPLQEEAELEVSRDGFLSDNSTIDVNPGTPHKVTVDLQPDTDEAQDTLDQEEQGDFEQRTTEQYLEEANQAYEQNPILEDLPKHGEFFDAYHGISEASGHDFAVHLYLYTGVKEEGRDEFNEWMNAHQYSVDDYDIVEHVKDEDPPTALPESPTWNELIELTPEDVLIEEAKAEADLSIEDTALLFAETATAWDTTEDAHHSEGLRRAKDLMTDEAEDDIFTPQKPNTNPAWRKASNFDGRSYPWVTYLEEDESSEEKQIEMDVCWAWVIEDDQAILDGPRTINVTIEETSSGPRISQFSYEDPDPFVDAAHNECHPEGAPSDQ